MRPVTIGTRLAVGGVRHGPNNHVGLEAIERRRTKAPDGTVLSDVIIARGDVLNAAIAEVAETEEKRIVSARHEHAADGKGPVVATDKVVDSNPVIDRMASQGASRPGTRRPSGDFRTTRTSAVVRAWPIEISFGGVIVV